MHRLRKTWGLKAREAQRSFLLLLLALSYPVRLRDRCGGDGVAPSPKVRTVSEVLGRQGYLSDFRGAACLQRKLLR